MSGSNNKKRDRPSLSPDNIQQVEKVQKMETQLVLNKLDQLFTKFEELQSTQNAIRVDISKLVERVQIIENDLDRLKFELQTLTARIDESDQIKLRNSFKITGIPYKQSSQEHLFVIVKKIFSLAGLDVEKEDFEYLAIYPNRNRVTGQIVGKFERFNKRTAIFRNFKESTKTTPILWKDVVNTEPNDPQGLKTIRLWSKLTQNTANLLARAKEYRNMYKYVWENEGRVLMRKNDGDRVLEIKSLTELASAVNGAPAQPQQQQHDGNNGMEA